MTDKERAVRNTSAATDGGQPLTIKHNDIIPQDSEKCNNEFSDNRRFFEELQRMSDPGYLPTISMKELFENVYCSKPPIIDGLLYPGTYLFVGAPKVGKSFLMAQLAYHVSTGTPLWGFPVKRNTVLYLALEDDYKRLQERLYRMFGTNGTDKLHFAVAAGQLGVGLEDQLSGFLKEHRDTTLVIIDTLQKIRESAGDSYSYANDYQVITQLKKFADQNGICLLLVHHTRKQQADDKFDMISGTNGLLGAADGAFLLHKEKRTDRAAALDISGRDQQDQRLNLMRNEATLAWDLVKMETTQWTQPKEPLLEAVAAVVSESSPDWTGTPSELAEVLATDMKPQTLMLKLNVNASRLLNEYGIRYDSSRSHTGRKVKLHFEGRDDA